MSDEFLKGLLRMFGWCEGLKVKGREGYLIFLTNFLFVVNHLYVFFMKTAIKNQLKQQERKKFISKG